MPDPASGGKRSSAPDELPVTAPLRYTLDANDAIVAVAGDWDLFALANGGEAILAARIVGRRLDDFITGDVTRMFVRTMLMSARTLKREVQRPYRCDSPQMKRLMQMTITPRGSDWLDVCHCQLHQEPWQRPQPIIAAASACTGTFIKRCSMCNRIRVRQEWGEVDEALPMAARLNVVYGVCPDCLQGVALRLSPAAPAIRAAQPVAATGKAPR